MDERVLGHFFCTIKAELGRLEYRSEYRANLNWFYGNFNWF